MLRETWTNVSLATQYIKYSYNFITLPLPFITLIHLHNTKTLKPRKQVYFSIKQFIPS